MNVMLMIFFHWPVNECLKVGPILWELIFQYEASKFSFFFLLGVICQRKTPLFIGQARVLIYSS